METLPTMQPYAPARLFAWAGFGLSAISAALSIFAILTWAYTADMGRDLEGGVAFSLNIIPFLATWAGIAVFPFAAICTAISVCIPLRGRMRVFTMFHGFSLTLLAPAAFLLFRMVSK